MLKCAICYMVKEGAPFNAVTVRGGTAVCFHHMMHARDEHVQNVFRGLLVMGGAIEFEKDTFWVHDECGGCFS